MFLLPISCLFYSEVMVNKYIKDKIIGEDDNI